MTTKKHTMLIRIVCGLFGLLGIAATIFNSLRADNFIFEFKLIAIAFACCIFLYVAITGTNPLGNAKKEDES